MWSAGKGEELYWIGMVIVVLCRGCLFSLLFMCVLFEIGIRIKGVLILLMKLVLCRCLERLYQIVEMLFLSVRYLAIDALLLVEIFKRTY
jgi:hypothetical protein